MADQPVFSERLPEHAVSARRLGRHIEHDARSLAFPAARAVELVSVVHERHCPPFDQGDTGRREHQRLENGTVEIAGSVRGGHEFAVVGIDTEARTVRACNSWGLDWGDHGYFQFSWDTWDQLLHERGDVTVVTTDAMAAT